MKPSSVLVGALVASLTIVLLVRGVISVQALQSQERELAPSSPSACAVTVHLIGSGQVNLAQDNGRVAALDAPSNTLPVDCGEEVTLSSQPYSLSTFYQWQGISGHRVQLPNITVSSPSEVTAVFISRPFEYETVAPYYNRAGEWVTKAGIYQTISQRLMEAYPSAADDDKGPQIDVWYESNDTLSFGQKGTPQEWINVLGNVSDTENNVALLSYELNGDGVTRLLAYGNDPVANWVDGRRLSKPGDFNIDIDKDNLRSLPQTNSVKISATDSAGNKSQYTVTLRYDASTSWEPDYYIDWSETSDLTSVAQVVDGAWQITPDGLHMSMENTGYDRLVAIGEGSLEGAGWEEYEVVVPVTVHGYSNGGFGQAGPALGIVLRWGGHTDTPVVCEQPKCGYLPVGAATWYQWRASDPTNPKLTIWPGTPSNAEDDGNTFRFEFNKTYIWKARVDNSNGPKGTYYLKVWEQGQAEPNWLVVEEGKGNSLESGSLLLLSHHVELTFGDVRICQDTCKDTQPPTSPTGNFSADPTQVTIGQPVQFTDLSSGLPTSWSWDFGDGGNSTVKNPNHTYSAAGIYTVSLTVANGFGSDSETKVDYIEVLEPLVISDIEVDTSLTEAAISWNTNRPASSRLDYSNSSGDSNSVSDPAFTSQHSVVLQGLEPNLDYEYQIFVTDEAGQEAVSGIRTFTTSPTEKYALEVATSGQGTVAKSPDKPEYESGEQVTLTAVPANARIYFAGWSSDAAGDKNPLVIIITKDTRIRALFEWYQVGDFTSYFPMALTEQQNIADEETP